MTDTADQNDAPVQNTPHNTVNPRSHKRLKILLTLMTTLLLLTLASAAYFFHPWEKTSEGTRLPRSIVANADFPVYFYEDEPPSGMKLDPTSVSYSSGLLIFKLTNETGSKSVTITEQALPSSLENSSIQGKERVEGVDGNAAISYDGTRAIGYLISSDKKTFVIINSAAKDTAIIQTLLRSLRPVQ